MRLSKILPAINSNHQKASRRQKRFQVHVETRNRAYGRKERTKLPAVRQISIRDTCRREWIRPEARQRVSATGQSAQVIARSVQTIFRTSGSISSSSSIHQPSSNVIQQKNGRQSILRNFDCPKESGRSKKAYSCETILDFFSLV